MAILETRTFGKGNKNEEKKNIYAIAELQTTMIKNSNKMLEHSRQCFIDGLIAIDRYRKYVENLYIRMGDRYWIDR